MTLDDLRALYVHPEGDHLAIDSMSVELEVAELLYALVRQSKPNVVVECGGGKGYASRFIAEGLEANGSLEGSGYGHLWTYEQDPDYWQQTCDSFYGGIAPVDRPPITVVLGLGRNHGGPPPDLVFIDSLGGEPRERDMDHWFACTARPLIVIHDANGYGPDTFARGEGVLLQAGRGVWVGRTRA